MSRLCKYFITVIFLFGLVYLSACNTGIESTKTIKMSKSDRKELLPTPEDRLAEEFFSQIQADWKVGKKFLVADDKAFLILKKESPGIPESEAGSILNYLSMSVSPSAGSEKICIVSFIDENTGQKYNFNTGKNIETVSSVLTGLDIPALIDLDLVAQVDSILKNRTVWIRSQNWYDRDGNIITGRKYVPVLIKEVVAGNMYFPLIIHFKDIENGKEAGIYMNVRASSGIGSESRTFPSLFYLEDPKSGYPSVDEEVWKLIQEGKIRIGMTKEECRLSLGNPPEVDAGHDWNNTIDLWRYKDGTFLHFENGLLVNYRH